jgi:hypothetical protein
VTVTSVIILFSVAIGALCGGLAAHYVLQRYFKNCDDEVRKRRFK